MPPETTTQGGRLAVRYHKLITGQCQATELYCTTRTASDECVLGRIPELLVHQLYMK